MSINLSRTLISFQKARLVETGAKKLTQLYTKVVAEGSSGITPAPGSSFMMSSFPSSLLPTLSPVVTFLRTLPLPATHPSHPAALSIFGTLKEAQKGYADMRGNWSVKCLEGQGKRLVARAESVDPLATGREFREWVELMLGTVEVSLALFLFCICNLYGYRKNTSYSKSFALCQTLSWSLVPSALFSSPSCSYSTKS